MRYMWKFFLLLMLVVTSCSEKQIDGNVINVAEENIAERVCDRR